MSWLKMGTMCFVLALAVLGGSYLVEMATSLFPLAWAQEKEERWTARAPGEPTAPFTRDGEPANPLEAGELARDRFALTQANLQDLARAKLVAATTAFEARWKEFLAGRGTQDFLIESARCVLESEQALSENTADQQAALEKYWQRLRLIEKVNKARWDAGRLPFKEYLESRYYRQQAEIWLLEARQKAQQK